MEANIVILEMDNGNGPKRWTFPFGTKHRTDCGTLDKAVSEARRFEELNIPLGWKAVVRDLGKIDPNGGPYAKVGEWSA